MNIDLEDPKLHDRMSREVASMEQGIIKLRSLLRTRTGVIRNLAEWIDPVHTLPNSSAKTNMYSKEIFNPSSSSSSSRSNPEYIAFSLPNVFDGLLAERKIELALATLEDGENLVRDCNACTSKDGNLSLLTPVTSAFLQAALKKRKNALLDYLAYMSKQPSVRGVELRAIVAYMDRLGEGAHAHTMLLFAHYSRFKRNCRGLHPIGTCYRGALTAALSQMAFSTILQASVQYNPFFRVVKLNVFVLKSLDLGLDLTVLVLSKNSHFMSMELVHFSRLRLIPYVEVALGGAEQCYGAKYHH